VVAESGFLDSHGTFVAGKGVRILEGSKYFVALGRIPATERWCYTALST